jgi:hypothetical protein
MYNSHGAAPIATLSGSGFSSDSPFFADLGAGRPTRPFRLIGEEGESVANPQEGGMYG